jgi:hypothetical protein
MMLSKLFTLVFVVLLPRFAFAEWVSVPPMYIDNKNISAVYVDDIKKVGSLVVFRARFETIPGKESVFINSMGSKVGSYLAVKSYDCGSAYDYMYGSKFFSEHNLKGKIVKSYTSKDFNNAWTRVAGGNNLFKFLCGKDADDVRFPKSRNSGSSGQSNNSLQSSQQDSINEQIRANQKLIRQIEREIEMDMLKDDIVDEIELRRSLR